MQPEPKSHPKYSVIVPAYNEAAHLEDLYRRLKSVFKKLSGTHEFIFIDDGSTDKTWSILQDLYEKDPSIVGIRMMRNFSQQSAWRAGFEAARGEYVVTLDADLQNPPEEVPRLLAKMEEGYDVVTGVRQNRQDGLLRGLASRCVNAMVSRMIGQKLHDIGCALRVHRRVAVDAFLQFPEKYQYFPVMFGMVTQRIAEVPVDHHARKSGKSHYPWTTLARLTFNLITSYSTSIIPAFFFGGILVAAGAALLAVLLWTGALADPGAWLVGLLSIYLFLLTIYALFLGEFIIRLYRTVQRRPDYVIREKLTRP